MTGGPYDDYRHAVDSAIAFAGQEHAFFLEAKAKWLLDLVRRRLGDPSGVRALDVGCGPGLMHGYLNAFGALDAVDPEETLIAAARTSHPAVRYHVADARALPYDDGAFDLAFAVSVLHHIPAGDRDAVAGELRRVVRAGGLAVVFEHNPWNPLTRLVVRRCAFDDDAELLSRRATLRLYRRCGLDPVETAYVLFAPWRGFERLERRLSRVPLGAQYAVAGTRNASHDAAQNATGRIR
jgi:SAM-dependent methyltransferase